MSFIQTKTAANQVDEILLQRIREGLYAPGSRMPSESDLSDELGVSRATVRTALAKLAANGLIIKKQGDGTYVNARAHEASAQFGSVWDLALLIEGNGYKPSIEPLAMQVRAATEKELLALALETGEKVVHLRRLFRADGKPVILSDNVIPLALLREPLESLNGTLHIRDIFQLYFHQKIVFAITEIRAVTASELTRRVLGGEAGRAMLQLHVTFYAKNNLPLALGINDFDDSALRLSLAQAWM